MNRRRLRFNRRARARVIPYLRERIERTMRYYGWGSEGYTSRQLAAVRVRTAAMHKLRRMGMGPTIIGRAFGLNHSTVLQALEERARRPAPPAIRTLRGMLDHMDHEQTVALYSNERSGYAIAVRERVVMQMRAMGYSYPEIGEAMRRNHSTIVDIHQRATQETKA